MFNIFKRQKAYIVFSSEYLVGVSTYGDHHSFDIFKYKRIRDLLVSQKVLKPKNIFYPEPCTFDDMRLVHTEKYIQLIKDPLYVNQALKIEINSLWENSVLEYYMAVSGGTIEASFRALEFKKPVFNLGGGFHHAQPEKAEGFCLLNDIAMAIMRLKKETSLKKFLIVDLDYHQGNGNGLIFKDDQNVFTFSVHADHWEDIESPRSLDVLVSSDVSNTKYISLVKENFEKVLKKFTPEIIFYVAGSDPYEKDELADMKISRETMLERNMFVLEQAVNRSLPLVILPGGGYGKDSWEIYNDFIFRTLKG